MLRFTKKSIGITILIFMLVVAPVFTAISAPPGPPGPGPSTGDVPIGGTTIGGGLLILFALAAGYGARKFYNARKRKISE